jgi:hypothetical protein
MAAASFVWRFAPNSPVPKNLPGMTEVDGFRQVRLNAQSYFFLLVQTGIAKERDVSLPAVRQWFEGGCLGAPRVGDLALVEREEVADDTGDVPGDEGEGESYL